MTQCPLLRTLMTMNDRDRSQMQDSETVIFAKKKRVAMLTISAIQESLTSSHCFLR